MARPLRVVRAGAWHHVFARGLNGMDLFRDDRDRRHLLELLESFVQRYGVRVHAYALMDTHFHLVLETPEPNLSLAMQWLNLSYAAWFSVRHRWGGPVFQRPFGSVPIEDGGWVYKLSVYVHLNPLRIAAFALSKRERQAAAAGLMGPLTAEEVRRRLGELRDFRWSSYRAYAGYAPCPVWLTTSEVLRRAARQTGQQAAAYRKDVQARLRQGAGDQSGDGLRDELAIGSVAFAARVQRLARAAGIGREAAGRRRLAGRATWADVVRAVARAKKEPWASFCDRYGDPGSSMALWLAQRYTGLRLREIGAACGGRDYSAVSVAIKRHAVRLKNDSAVADLQRKAEQLLIVEMSPQ